MVNTTILMAVLVAAVAFAGCTSGDGGNGDVDSTGSTTTGGGGVGGNVTVGNGTANATVSGSFTGTSTNSTNSSANGTSDAPMSANVSIEDSSFVNDTVTIRMGGTVTWTHNDGTTPHTVTSDDGEFDSGACDRTGVPLLPPPGSCLTEGETFSWTFSEAGTFAYHCEVHDGMTGTVRVVA